MNSVPVMVDTGLNTGLEGMLASALFFALKIIHESQLKSFVHCNYKIPLISFIFCAAV
jgi:hypothetical protein